MVTHTLLLASSHALSLTKFTLSRRLTSRNGGREGHKRGSDGDNYHCWCVNRMPALSVRTLMSKTATGQSVAACDLCETRRYAGCEWTLKSESECTLTKARIESHANWTATRVVECYRDTSNGAANMCDENLCSTHENTKKTRSSAIQGCPGYGNPHGDPHGCGYGVGMGMIFHPHRPMGLLWGFFNQPEITTCSYFPWPSSLPKVAC